jgi:ABC-type sugar transport system permease subunit
MTAIRIPQRWRMAPLARREARQGLLFLSPWILGFVVFTAFPMVATLGFSLTNISLAQETPLRFVGLDNYQRLLNDRTALHALSVTLRFGLLWLPVSIILPFVVALLLNSRHLLFRGGFRVLIFMPYVVPFVAGVLVWQGMLSLNGWINDSCACSACPTRHCGCSRRKRSTRRS